MQTLCTHIHTHLVASQQQATHTVSCRSKVLPLRVKRAGRAIRITRRRRCSRPPTCRHFRCFHRQRSGPRPNRPGLFLFGALLHSLSHSSWADACTFSRSSRVAAVLLPSEVEGVSEGGLSFLALPGFAKSSRQGAAGMRASVLPVALATTPIPRARALRPKLFSCESHQSLLYSDSSVPPPFPSATSARKS